MRKDSGLTRVVGWLVLGIFPAQGVLLLVLERGRARANETSPSKAADDQALVEARAVVKTLEARLRSTEASLGKARELVANLEGKPITVGPVKAGAIADSDEDDTNSVEGVWRIVGVNGHTSGEYRKPPYDEYKIMSAGHYLWLSFDPETGEVVRSGGGTYRIKGGVYTARIECSNSADLRAVAGGEYKGTCRIDGKKWYHFGSVPSGAGFDELWERVH
jgi:hypothetical protein